MINYSKLLKDIQSTYEELREDMKENPDYKRGYHAGRLHALLEVKGDLTDD